MQTLCQHLERELGVLTFTFYGSASTGEKFEELRNGTNTSELY